MMKFCDLNHRDMSNKVVLITGTNSGFGWLTAHSVAALGHKVYATIRNTKGKNADKAKALAQVNNVTVLDVDLTDETGITTAIDTVLTNEGRLDVVVNNAGFTMSGVAESFTTDDVRRMFEVNTFAPWTLTRLALPAMRKQGEGLIINVSSGFGAFALPFSTVYAASKFGLEGLTEGLHYEVRQLGVDVVILQPGAFPTEMGQKVQPSSDPTVNEGYAAVAEYGGKMMGAIGEMITKNQPNPQQVADAVVDLIGMPKGKRPLRTVVDPNTGDFVRAANEAVQAQLEKGMVAFGMEGLLA